MFRLLARPRTLRAGASAAACAAAAGAAFLMSARADADADASSRASARALSPPPSSPSSSPVLYDEPALRARHNFHPGSKARVWSGEIRADMESLVKRVQDEICAAVAAADGGGQGFHEDAWTRPEGGGGRSRVLQGGKVFEKAGVNVSVVHGQLPAAAVAQMRSRGKEALGGSGPFPFFACGVSLVLHPHNPHAPTAHANYRYFEVEVPLTKEERQEVAAKAAKAAAGAKAEGGAAPPPLPTTRKLWWFGGGADLTPSLLYDEDAVHFHGTLKAALDAHDPPSPSPPLYPRFKAWADDYFLIPHRGERRGVGGVFFDDLDTDTLTTVGANFLPAALKNAGAGGGQVASSSSTASSSPYPLLNLVADAAESFVPAYVPIVEARKDAPYTEEQKRWQQLRRGRYAEFNLVYDR
jgi:coproporphyrinogen III oxidase